MTYDDVAHYLGIDDPQGRHTCPVCGSSDGLGIDPDQGDTGTAHCFSCGFGETEPGTGAQLYAEVERVEIAEALQAFGIDGSDLSRKVKQREDTAPRPRVPEKTDAELDEERRAWHAMTPGELQLRDEYRRRRALAAHDLTGTSLTAGIASSRRFTSTFYSGKWRRIGRWIGSTYAFPNRSKSETIRRITCALQYNMRSGKRKVTGT